MRKTVPALAALAAALTVSAAETPHYKFLAFDAGGREKTATVARKAGFVQWCYPSDFAALQGVSSELWADTNFIARLSRAYEVLGRGLGPDGTDAPTPVLVARRRFETVASGGRWTGSDGAGPCGFVWAVVRDRTADVRFVAFSARLARSEEGVAVLDETVRALAARHGAVPVGGGDFGADAAARRMDCLWRNGWLDAQETTPGWDARPTWRDRSPDHILYGAARIEPYEFRLESTKTATELTEHRPICFDFRLADASSGRPCRGADDCAWRPYRGLESEEGGTLVICDEADRALFRLARGEFDGSRATNVVLRLDAKGSLVDVFVAVRRAVRFAAGRFEDARIAIRPVPASNPVAGAANREIRKLADGVRIVAEGFGDEPSAASGSRVDVSGTRGKWWWASRLAEKQCEIARAGGEFDVVMLGDSITHFWEDFDYWSHGREVFEEMCRSYRILDLGYGGDHTENLLWRLGNGELDGYRTKLFQLMIGTNNRNPPEETAAHVREIVSLLRTRHPEAKVLLLPIFPRGRPGDVNRLRNEKANALLRALADGESVVWFDFNDRFLQPDGSFKPGLMIGDLLHPKTGGYRLWKDAVLPVWRRLTPLGKRRF